MTSHLIYRMIWTFSFLTEHIYMILDNICMLLVLYTVFCQTYNIFSTNKKNYLDELAYLCTKVLKKTCEYKII